MSFINDMLMKLN
jgi:hypothetical protein